MLCPLCAFLLAFVKRFCSVSPVFCCVCFLFCMSWIVSCWVAWIHESLPPSPLPPLLLLACCLNWIIGRCVHCTVQLEAALRWEKIPPAEFSLILLLLLCLLLLFPCLYASSSSCVYCLPTPAAVAIVEMVAAKNFSPPFLALSSSSIWSSSLSLLILSPL